ncbi:DUF221-domain-containing protein [Tilletiaria anomala UBC 951]|uniref:DUF221-domain-containing protein n=1 Tax=Tilletiaria anomala (strain ATCC 24038 / CBS 436.72 / UBC 951) TaxID=1037660 RepID=A0A066W6T5_TILAU|nr:DUF221-domain-containing protein [Tilletiaria anomala UBC 951]KDN46784.1 DUF221-domain-containing protein [Tilletiaria anomala UBC 951]
MPAASSRMKDTTLLGLLPLLLAASAPQHVAAQSATQQQSTQTVLSSIILNGAIFLVEIVVFFILRPKFRKVYQPKSYLGPEDERVPPQSPSLFGWITPFIKMDKSDILHRQGLDAYMYLEYLELMIITFGPIFFLTWAVLMPLYATGVTRGSTGFNQFTFGNVGSNTTAQLRYIGTLLVQWVCTLWLLYNIQVKVSKFVKLRQEFIVSEKHATTAQAKTLLVTGVPNNLLTEDKLKALYSHLPGGVAHVWINRNLKDLPGMCDERLKWCNKLEGAEASIIKTAFTKIKKGKVEGVDASSYLDGAIPLDLAEKYIAKKERPTHKVGSKIPCMGTEVDTIEWCREEIAKLNHDIEAKRHEVATDFEKYPADNSAFLLFNQQIAAHMAQKAQTHHLPYRMVDRYIEAHPNNVVWSTLNMNPYEKKIRTLVFWLITLALVFFWTVPVGFVAIISNIQGLAEKVHWLSWLDHIGPVTGIIQGILPTVLLAVLNMLLPIFLRLFTQLSGVPTRTGIELSLMDRFFLFQIIQNFLFLTIVSGSIRSVSDFLDSLRKNPSAFPGLIATAVPKGSTFFLSYIALQGLAGAGSGFVQLVPLVVYYIKKFLLGSTPRKLWHIDNDMGSVSWGTLFPVTSLITVIAIGYMVIAPIVVGFALVTFILYYALYRYNFTYVYDQKPETETSGLFFPKAINQIFAGLYLELVMLAALFFLVNAPDSNGGTKQTAIPEGAFTVVLIVLVAGFHYFLNNSYGPLYNSLPLTLVLSTNANAPQSGATAAKLEESLYALTGSDVEKNVSHDSPVKEVVPSHINGALDAHGSKAIDTLNEGIMSAFDHPAVKEDQRTLWFPNDRLGMGLAAVKAAQKHQLSTTNVDTKYDEKNRLEVSASIPPGESLD